MSCMYVREFFLAFCLTWFVFVASVSIRFGFNLKTTARAALCKISRLFFSVFLFFSFRFVFLFCFVCVYMDNSPNKKRRRKKKHEYKKHPRTEIERSAIFYSSFFSFLIAAFIPVFFFHPRIRLLFHATPAPACVFLGRRRYRRPTCSNCLSLFYSLFSSHIYELRCELEKNKNKK